ncbi:uncharacterized protein I206_106809 [Kwoniella pini CBS 10737]|uniref:NmrA-like domain-containing protein n=1 Tax=Kwoniella pini CBS 10737 TaxID=1296096 RepID=A0AAJ8LCQ2_9TREE
MIKYFPNYLYSPAVKQAFGLIDEAINHQVKYFAYTSGNRGGEKSSWGNETPVPHSRTKHHIERYLSEQINNSKTPTKWTIFSGTMFYENLEPTFSIKVFMSAYKDTLGSHKICQ